ncbi:MAG: beta-propeller domain-containing protein [Polyangiales bacterium]
MARLGSLTFSLLGLCLFACDTTSGAESTDPDGGTPRKMPKVGDSVGGGKVTEVTSRGGDTGCYAVTVETAPAWTCSAEQIAQASKGWYDTDSTKVPDVGVSTPALRVSDCKSLAALRRPALKSTQRASLASQRQALLRNCLPTAQVSYFDGSGAPRGSCGFAGGGLRDAAVSAARPTQNDSDPGAGAQQYSTTNTQVADVDEADFVKNDAGYVYVLSAKGLQVFDAWPAADTHELASVAIEGSPTRMFLAENKLVVYARTPGSSSSPSAAASCTYGYGCRAQAEPGGTLVQVFDVSTPAAPRELGRYELSGGYVSSRRVGNFVYTVVADEGLGTAPGVDLSLSVSNPAQLDVLFEQRTRDADAVVDGLADEYFLPWLRVQSGQLAQTTPVGCSGGMVAQAASGASFTSLVSFDLTTLGAPRRTLVASKPGFVYASGKALYLATDGDSGSDERTFYSRAADERSSMHKFVLDGVDTRYVGSTLIPGHVLNQFSMDERDGVLRVATSSGWVGTPGVSSNVVTLAEQGGGLAIVGKLQGLAPEEDIRSVRFDGERAFVVTFKKTDPLYAIDLLNPAQPRVLGELKIPGFSTYMHPMDRDHVLAIGFDADDHVDFAFFNGIQLQIFDVSDLSHPKLQHKTVIGTRGSASEALTNHLAFNYFAAKGLLALPMTVCDGGGDGRYADKLTFSGLMVFDVSLDKGIVERGRMPFVDPSSYSAYGCSQWWTESKSDVKRSIIMDDYVVGISDSQYQVAGLPKLDTVLKSLPVGR